MYLVFFKTTDVFFAEELLQKHNISSEIVPTPVQDKAYCGVCMKINDVYTDQASTILEGMNYKIIN